MEVLAVLLDVVGVVVHRLSLVHGVEVEAGIVGLYGLEESSESILKTTPAERSTMRAMQCVERTTSDLFTAVGTLFRVLRCLP